MLLLLAPRCTSASGPMRTVMLDATEALTAFLAQLVLAVHPWSTSTSLYQQGTYTQQLTQSRGIT